MTGRYILSGFSDEISPDLEEQLTQLKKLGIRYFEIRGVGDKNVSDLTQDEARDVRAMADRYGIRVSSVGSPIGKIKITDDFEPHLEKLAHVILLSKIFETRFIRVFSFFIPEGADPADFREEVMARMRAMTQLAEREGVILLHENEKGIYGDTAPRCKDLLDTVNSPALRAVFDPANFVECGQSTYPEAYDLLNSYVVYIHIKDALGMGRVVPSGYGKGKIEMLLRAFADKGYEGFLSLEPHLTHFTGLDQLQSESLELSKEPLSGAQAFTIAYDALNAILERIDNRA